MPSGTISATITSTVTIGPGGYPNLLTVTSTGAIAPSAFAATGLFVDPGLGGVSILNLGTISGAYGPSGNGGVGVDLASPAVLSNGGLIEGGVGGYSPGSFHGNGGTGGAGVDLAAGGTATNDGAIVGGGGGDGGNFGNGAAGGVGIVFAVVGTLTNEGTVAGGGGGGGRSTDYGFGSTCGNGGVGVDLAAGGMLTNDGTIAGGVGGRAYIFDTPGTGGVGIAFAALGTLTNDGSITGGSGGSYGYGSSGAAGVDFAAGGVLTNSGSIAGGVYGGGHDGLVGGNGGDAVDFGSGGTLTNTGYIAGGAGGGAYGPNGGGAGADLAAQATMTNSGTIAGGWGNGDGGAGVELGSGGTLGNSGSIKGGGATGGNVPAYGGVGVDLGSGGTLSNSGSITGGGAPSAGGAGVDLGSGGSLSNSGSIAGGASFSDGGAGVYLVRGGTLTNSGTIAGGTDVNGGAGDAVAFGSVAGATLVIDPGAVFNGLVAASPEVNDVLDLAGRGASTLDGLGSQFSGFRTLRVAVGADWTLIDAGSLGKGAKLLDAGVLDVASGQFVASVATMSPGGSLQATGTGSVNVLGVTLKAGRLGVAATGTVVVGANATGAAAGEITVRHYAEIAGSGIIGGVVDDRGTIDASGGALTLAGAVAGPGTVEISPDAVLRTEGGVATRMTFLPGGNETVALRDPLEVTGIISGFVASDTIDLLGQVATVINFSTSTDVLTVLGARGLIAALHFAGDTTGGFAFGTDHHGGTFITHS